jgi:hypothetical protein
MALMYLSLAASVLFAASELNPIVQSQASTKPAGIVADPKGVRDFDFERGEWRVHHRVKRAGQNEWTEFEGTCRNRELIDGSANVEEHTFVRPSGVTYGIAMRAFDSKSEQWAIWWVDGRDPHGTLDPPPQSRGVLRTASERFIPIMSPMGSLCGFDLFGRTSRRNLLVGNRRVRLMRERRGRPTGSWNLIGSCS